MTDERLRSDIEGEFDLLIVTLDYLRRSVLRKLSGLSDEQARKSMVASGTSIGGLIQHLTFVESFWFEEIVTGNESGLGDRSMDLDEAATVTLLGADYEAACERSNEIVREVGDLDAPTSRERHGRSLTLRWVMVHMIEETARHAGHADIIREHLDGTTGR